ncbi:hypothetical protein D3C86_2201430 [compost metagenome]
MIMVAEHIEGNRQSDDRGNVRRKKAAADRHHHIDIGDDQQQYRVNFDFTRNKHIKPEARAAVDHNGRCTEDE